MISIGVQVASLKLPLRKALPKIAAMGAQGVELDARSGLKPAELGQTGLRAVRKLLDDYGLRLSAVSFQTRRGYDVADDLQRRIDATKGVLRFAYSLGCSCVLNQVGTIRPPVEGDARSAEAWQRLVSSLSDLGNYSQRVGAWLTMTTGTESAEDMSQLIAALPEGSVRVNFDPGNLIVHGFSASESLQSLAQHVGHVQARDAVRDLARGRGLEVPLGRGTADFPYFAALLAEVNYRGFWTVARENSTRPEEELGLAVQFLREMGS